MFAQSAEEAIGRPPQREALARGVAVGNPKEGPAFKRGWPPTARGPSGGLGYTLCGHPHNFHRARGMTSDPIGDTAE